MVVGDAVVGEIQVDVVGNKSEMLAMVAQHGIKGGEAKVAGGDWPVLAAPGRQS